MFETTWLWVGFNLLIFTLLGLDLFVFNRKSHVIKVKEALAWTAFWMSLSLTFCAFLAFAPQMGIQGPAFGKERAQEYLTGYLIEQALSVDNLFVILMLFTFFRTPTAFQHKVLFWGILGVVVFRITFIFAGAALLQQFHWMVYILGGFLIYTALSMLLKKEEKDPDPNRNIAIRLVRRLMPVTDLYHDSKFFVKLSGRNHATPLFVVLLVIETTDILFALDSIPAVLAISKEPFIVYSSNIFAVLGLRSLYFALAGIMDMFKYLKYGISVILLFVGVKILVENVYHIDSTLSLIIVLSILAISIIVSLLLGEKEKMPPHHPPHEHKNKP